LRILLGFAHDRGWINQNPLPETITKLEMPRDDRHANRPWTEAECKCFLDRAPCLLLVPVTLAMCGGLRKSDFLLVTLSSLKDGAISVQTAKRRVLVSFRVHPILQAALERRPKSDAVPIAVNSRGEPWTETGVNASFIKFRKQLEGEGLIAPGLTPHGLRLTLATRLREAGADGRTIADILRQKSTAISRHDSSSARLPDAAGTLLKRLDPTKRANRG
jgi:integrase